MDGEAGLLREEIAKLVGALDENPTPCFEKMASYRLLASNTLLHKSEERTRWDRANSWMAGELEKGRAIDMEVIAQINAFQTGGDGAIRGVPVYSCGEEFLAPSALEAALNILKKDVFSESDPFVKASRLYSCLVVAHPFLDGNGRTARLAADYVLLGAGYLPLCFSSSIQSHVGLFSKMGAAGAQLAYHKCLRAIRQSYRIVLAPPD